MRKNKKEKKDNFLLWKILAILAVIVIIAVVFRDTDNKKDENLNKDSDTKEVIKKEKDFKKDDSYSKSDGEKKESVEKIEEGRTYTTKSGIKYEVLKLGTGEKPKVTDEVEVHYVGMTEDGKVFDSSVKRGHKAVFGLNKVIRGWTEGLQLMPVGSKFKFTIPGKLAYGETEDQKEICIPKSFLESAQGKRIDKKNFTGKKCKTENTQKESVDGELLINSRYNKLSGKTLIFEVELFDIKNKNKNENKK